MACDAHAARLAAPSLADALSRWCPAVRALMNRCAAIWGLVSPQTARVNASSSRGVIQLPSAVGVLVRITTDHAPELHRAQQLLLDAVRERLL